MKDILSTLGGLGYKVFNEDFVNFSTDPCITVKQISNTVVAQSDTQEYWETVYQIKTWHPRLMEAETMAASVRETLRALGSFEFSMAQGGEDVSQYIMRFRMRYHTKY